MSNYNIFIEDENTVKERMLSRVTNDVDKSVGSFTNDVISAMSYEVGSVYATITGVLLSRFYTTAQDDDLIERAKEVGLTRKLGVNATGTVKVVGNNGVIIPKDTVFVTENNLKYLSTTTTTITGGQALINIVAVNVGSEYNVPSNVITKTELLISGVTSVTNELPLTNGVAIEDLEELRNRIALKTVTPATSGNPNHYKLWALEVNGIGDVKVIPTWNGGATVKVVCISNEKLPISVEKLNEVVSYIQSVRPIGANVTCISAIAKVINVTVSIQRNSSISTNQVQTNLEENLRRLLRENAFKNDYVSYALFGGEVLKTEGVIDYTNLRLNNGTTNVTLTTDEVAILGSVTITWT